MSMPMLSNIFTKTLYEKRWGMFWWSLAMLVFTLLIVLSFPIFQDSFGQQLNDVPESLRSIIGEASDYQRVEGFLELQVFMQMVFLTFIYGIILCTGLLAGKEGEGTLQSLLAQPVSRTSVYVQTIAAAAVMLAVVSVALFVGVWLGLVIIGESTSLLRLGQATFMQWLVAMVFSLFGYSIGAISGRRGLAGALAGVYAFLAYIVSSLAATVTMLKYVNYASPFKYFQNPRVMDNGLQLGNVTILIVVCVALLVVGWMVFIKRDIYQR